MHISRTLPNSSTFEIEIHLDHPKLTAAVSVNNELLKRLIQQWTRVATQMIKKGNAKKWKQEAEVQIKQERGVVDA